MVELGTYGDGGCSAGVLAYELIVGYPCFETQSNEATFTKITTVRNLSV